MNKTASLKEMYEILANETIIIFSQIVKERKQFSIKTLSEKFSASRDIANILHKSQKGGNKLYEIENLKSNLRENSKKIVSLKSHSVKKTHVFFQLVKSFSLLLEGDERERIDYLLERIKENVKSAETFNEKIVDSTIKEIEDIILSSRKTDKGEEVRNKSFFKGIFKHNETHNEVDLISGLKESIKELLVTIILRFQSDNEDLNERIDLLSNKINRHGFFAPGDIKAEICEIIGQFKEILNAEKDDLYKVMEEIITRLIDTERDLLIAVKNNRESSNQNNIDFHKTFTEEIEGIEKGIQRNSVEEIRGVVFEKINNIKSALKSKKSLDGSLNNEIMEYINRLQVDLSKNEEDMQEVRNRAELDSLTGIYNRAAFQKRLKEEYESFEKEGFSSCLILMDVDNFKEINKEYTYDNGDRIIQTIAKVVEEKIPKKYFLARYGGGEFAIILPETELFKAKDLAEFIRKLILDIEFLHLAKKVPVTLSLGVREFDKNKTPIQLLQQVSKALQQAKRNGKNRVG